MTPDRPRKSAVLVRLLLSLSSAAQAEAHDTLPLYDNWYKFKIFLDLAPIFSKHADCVSFAYTKIH